VVTIGAVIASLITRKILEPIMPWLFTLPKFSWKRRGEVNS